MHLNPRSGFPSLPIENAVGQDAHDALTLRAKIQTGSIDPGDFKRIFNPDVDDSVSSELVKALQECEPNDLANSFVVGRDLTLFQELVLAKNWRLAEVVLKRAGPRCQVRSINGVTVFHAVARYGNVADMEYLDTIADLAAVDRWTVGDCDKRTPLHWAALGGDADRFVYVAQAQSASAGILAADHFDKDGNSPLGLVILRSEFDTHNRTFIIDVIERLSSFALKPLTREGKDCVLFWLEHHCPLSSKGREGAVLSRYSRLLGMETRTSRRPHMPSTPEMELPMLSAEIPGMPAVQSSPDFSPTIASATASVTTQPDPEVT